MQVLLISDVAEMLKVSQSSISRWEHDVERHKKEMIEWKSAKKGERLEYPNRSDTPRRQPD